MNKIIKPILGIIVGLGIANPISGNAQTTVNFNFTGAQQTWTVPCGVDSVIIDMAGAKAGDNGSSGGTGGRVQCTYYTTPSTVFNIFVGGQGAPGASLAPGGFNGGGNAGISNGGFGSQGSGGGGATDIRVGGITLNDRVIVAGGGGGVNQYNPTGGNGGDSIGGDATNTGNGCFTTYATGGTQSSGGLDATTSGFCCTFPIVPDGSFGIGADGSGPSANCNNGDGGAGGGGGYYGGGGGGGYGSGAGGSSYTNLNCTNVIHTQGYQSGDGYLSITYYTGFVSMGASIISNVTCFNANSGSARAVVVGGSTPYTFTWQPSGGTGDTAMGLSAGTYTVKVTDNCGDKDSASVTITQPTALVLTDSVTNATCHGSADGMIKTMVTGGTGLYTYNWSNGNTTAITTGLTAGSYTLTVTDSNGCTVTANPTVTQPPAINITLDSMIVDSCRSMAWAVVSGGTPGYSFMWTPSGATTDTISNLCNNTSYKVVVTDSHGCTDSASVRVVIAGVNDITNNTSINVYPVPASGVLNVDMGDNTFGLSGITIYDITGRAIREEKTMLNAKHLILDVSTLDNGFYLLRLTGSNGAKNIRFEVSR